MTLQAMRLEFGAKKKQSPKEDCSKPTIQLESLNSAIRTFFWKKARICLFMGGCAASTIEAFAPSIIGWTTLVCRMPTLFEIKSGQKRNGPQKEPFPNQPTIQLESSDSVYRVTKIVKRKGVNTDISQ